VEGDLRSRFGMVSSLTELRSLLDLLVDQPYPEAIGDAPRGRTSHGRPVTLPDGWLNDPFEFAHVASDDAGTGG